jgi:hypothetical protein
MAKKPSNITLHPAPVAEQINPAPLTADRIRECENFAFTAMVALWVEVFGSYCLPDIDDFIGEVTYAQYNALLAATEVEHAHNREVEPDEIFMALLAKLKASGK